MTSSPAHNHSTHTKEEQINGLLERLNAYIEHYHGGSVELVSFENDVLTVRLGGACSACPLLPSTLQGWVAGTIHQFFPEVEVVSAK
ncbi:MAG: NifU family protein [Anaerolineales bacterium]|nr:NifU family protein [Anaerolineales bacterium]